MELWIPLTIAAAFFQNIRSAMQKHLRGKLSTLGASYVRFVYAWPIALIYLFAVIVIEGQPLPGFNSSFLLYALFGGICQIMFTIFLLWLFSFHNFAVGTTFSKLETVMVAIFGLVLLGDQLTPAIIVAIAISTAGLIVLSAGQAKLSIKNLISGLWRLPTLIGLACAAWLGMSVVLFRAASLSLNLDSFMVAAVFTLLIVLIMQIAIMTVLIGLREPTQLQQGHDPLATRDAGWRQWWPGFDWVVQRLHAAKRNLCSCVGTDRADLYVCRNIAIFSGKGSACRDCGYPADHRRNHHYPAGGLTQPRGNRGTASRCSC